jgi:branched-chain amino acid transport system ATP-binding protein
MLEIDRLEITYGREKAVRGISLSVTPGEAVGLVGPNGAGKSSTMNATVGLVKPSGGDVRFDGASVVGQAPDAIARHGVSLVPEGRRVFGEMTVRENLILGLTVRPRGTDTAADIERVLERFPVLRRLYGTAAGKLSGGEQQQLAIARALVASPRLLLLDEPSLGLAPQFVDVVFEILDELRADGVTMLLVEQNVARTIAFCDRTYIIRAGRIELSGSREELQKQDELAQAYLGG